MPLAGKGEVGRGFTFRGDAEECCVDLRPEGLSPRELSVALKR